MRTGNEANIYHCCMIQVCDQDRHEAPSLFSSGLLYAIGGFDGVSPLKSGEQFDIGTNKWTPIPDMTSKRFGLGACACDGEGVNNNKLPVTYLHLHFSLPLLFSSLPSPLHLSFPSLPFSSLSGMIYAVGGSDGSNLNTAEYYNTTTKTWSSIAPMHTCRKFPGVKALGRAVYAVGGCDTTTRHNSVERYGYIPYY